MSKSTAAATVPKSSSSPGVFSVIGKLIDDYSEKTPKKIRLVDAYMLCILLTGIFQFVYCCLVGTYPFNAFLSGFISTVASFVLAGPKFTWFFYYSNYMLFKIWLWGWNFSSLFFLDYWFQNLNLRSTFLVFI